jgi:small-conductance mechanosensitive channel
MHRPWQKHLSIAILLASIAFAVGELWNVMAGAAIGAVAFFIALRPLFRNRRTRS